MLTTVDVPESLLAEIDALVASRKASKGPLRKSSPAHSAEARRIAEAEGAAAANAYLRSLNPRPKASRSAVIIDVLRGIEQLPSAAKGRGAQK